jgi:hypothetical protein
MSGKQSQSAEAVVKDIRRQNTATGKEDGFGGEGGREGAGGPIDNPRE